MDDLPPLSPPLAQRAASGAIWIALEMGTTQGTSLLIFAIVARFVTPSDFGLISISYLAIYTFKALVIDNVVMAVSRKQHPSDLEYTTSFWLTLTFAAIAAVVVFLSAEIAEQLMGAPHLKDVMRAMSIILLFMGLARTHEMRLIRTFQFRALALRAIVGTIVGGGVGIALAARDYGLIALVVQQVTTSALSLALLWANSSWTPSFRLSSETAFEILRFMTSTAPINITNIVSQNSDTFLVAYFLGSSSVGLYAIAKRLRLALQLVAATPINGVVFSTLAEVQEDRERLRRVSRQMIALSSFVCAPIFIGSSSIAQEIISISFGPQWTAAAPIFAVFTLGGYFATIQGFCDTVFVLKNRQIWSFCILLAQTMLSVMLFYPIAKLGQDYLALPFVIPYLITFFATAILISRVIGISLFEWLLAIAPSLASSILMFGAVKLTDSCVNFSSSFVQAATYSALGAMVYFFSMLVFDRAAVVANFQTILSTLKRVWSMQ
jgi:O-antigen/teichoic acid export membrane protein